MSREDRPADESAIETLAERLHYMMEKLDPAYGEAVEWLFLTERDREVYRSCIRDLSAYEDDWLALLSAAKRPRNK
jgi:hypothetical protein